MVTIVMSRCECGVSFTHRLSKEEQYRDAGRDPELGREADERERAAGEHEAAGRFATALGAGPLVEARCPRCGRRP